MVNLLIIKKIILRGNYTDFREHLSPGAKKILFLKRSGQLATDHQEYSVFLI